MPTHYEPEIPPPLRMGLVQADGNISRPWATYFQQRAIHGVHIDIEGPIAVGNPDMTRPVALVGGKLRFVTANLRDAPSGGDAVIDVEKTEDGGITWVSVFRSGNAKKLTMPAGSSLPVTLQTFDSGAQNIIRDTLFRLNILQIGSASPGSFLQVVVGWS